MKFSERFENIPGCSYIIDDPIDISDIDSLSLESLIEKYSKSQRPYKDEMYHSIHIINPNADNRIEEIPEMTYKELREYLYSHVRDRYILVKPDLSEICIESFIIYIDDDTFIEFCFDIGILYGDYKLPEYNKIYKTDIEQDCCLDRNRLGYDLVVMDESPRDNKDDIAEKYHDVHVALVATSIIDNKWYWTGGPFIPIASLSEFNPEKDINANKLMSDL